jgi:hypothetical protein
LDYDTIEAVRIAGMWKKGIAPEAGGYMDQTLSIADACDQIWTEQDAWKQRLGVLDG